MVTLDEATRAEAERHVERETHPVEGCTCANCEGGQTYCTWCGDEWPCTVARMLEAVSFENG